MLAGMDIYEVEPGTKINGPNGETLTVQDDSAVCLGRKMWVTPKTMSALRAKIKEAENG